MFGGEIWNYSLHLREYPLKPGKDILLGTSNPKHLVTQVLPVENAIPHEAKLLLSVNRFRNSLVNISELDQ